MQENTKEQQVFRALRAVASDLGFRVIHHRDMDTYAEALDAVAAKRTDVPATMGPWSRKVDSLLTAFGTDAVTTPTQRRIDLAPSGDTAAVLAHELSHALNETTDGNTNQHVGAFVEGRAYYVGLRVAEHYGLFTGQTWDLIVQQSADPFTGRDFAAGMRTADPTIRRIITAVDAKLAQSHYSYA